MIDDFQKINETIERATQLLEQEEPWPRVDSVLGEAEEIASNDPQLIGQTRVAIMRLKTRRQKVVEQIFAEVEEALASEEVDSFRLRENLRRALNLAVDRQDAQQRFDELEEKVIAREKEDEMREVYKDLQRELHEKWEKGEQEFRTERGQQAIVDEYFLGGYQKAEQVAAQYPNYEPIQHLAREAKDRYDDEREKALMPTTYQAVGQHEDLLTELKVIQEETPDRRFEIEDENGQIRNVPIDEAIRITMRRIGEASQDRVLKPETGYLAVANRYLKDHDPKSADSKLREARRLPGLNDDTKAKINSVLKEVTTELELYSLAEQLAENAVSDADLSLAWRELEKAKEKYQWAHAVTRAHETILRRARDEFERRLNQARNLIEDGKIYEGERLLSDLQREQIYIEILGSVDDRINAVKSIITRINEEKQHVDEIKSNLQNLVSAGKYKKAFETINDFLERYPNANRRDRDLDRLYRQIGLQVDMKRLPPMLEDAYNSNDYSIISEAIKDADAALGNDPELARENRIHILKQDLVGRKKVLEAQRLWFTRSDRKAASRLLQEVAGSQAAKVDKDRADELLRQIRESENVERRLRDILPSIEVLIRDNDYKRAYDELVNLMDSPPVSSDVQQKRDEYWGIITDGLISQTVSELTLMLDTESNELDTFRELHERLQSLGARNVDLIDRRTQERIAVLRAERSEEVGDWKTAQRSWERARHFSDASTEYYRRFVEARRQNTRTEINRLSASPDQLQQALSAVDNYIQLMPNHVEPRVWKLDVLIRIASEAQEPRLFENGWRQVASSVDLAQLLVQNQSRKIANEKPEAEARNQLEERAKQSKTGNKDAQLLIRLQRTLVPAQSLTTLRSAVLQIRKFVKNRSKYRGIVYWWTQLHQPDLIEQLETSARENLTNYWDAFSHYAHILAVMEHHDKAVQFVSQMAQRLPELIALVDAACNNVQGPLIEVPMENLIKQQIEELRKIQNHVTTAITCRSFFKDDLQIEAEDFEQISEQLDEANKKITVKLQELRILDQNYTTALNLAETRGVLDQWQDYDKQVSRLKTIHDGIYADHRIIAELQNRKEALDSKRKMLQQLIAVDITAGFDRQDFSAVKNQMAILEQEDPTDRFQLQENAHFIDPITQNTINGIEALYDWLEEAEGELKRIIDKLRPIVTQSTLERLQKLPLNEVRAAYQDQALQLINITQDTYLLNWEQIHKDTIKPLHDAANFSDAYRQTQTVIHADDTVDEADPAPAKKYTLRAGSQYLASIAMAPARGQTWHSRLLLKLTQELETRITRDLQQARRYLDTIKSDAEKFVALLNDFDAALQQLAQSDNESNHNRVRETHTALMELTPEYDGVYALNEYKQLAN